MLPGPMHKVTHYRGASFPGERPGPFHVEPEARRRVPFASKTNIGALTMGRYLLLWMLGIPIPILLLIWLFGGLH